MEMLLALGCLFVVVVWSRSVGMGVHALNQSERHKGVTERTKERIVECAGERERKEKEEKAVVKRWRLLMCDE